MLQHRAAAGGELQGMSVTTAERAGPANQTRLVVAASAIGTAFEWYDFFIFGTLAAIMAKQFTGGSDTAGFIFALGAFAAGFFVRPFGALFFGRLGDQIDRKSTRLNSSHANISYAVFCLK